MKLTQILAGASMAIALATASTAQVNLTLAHQYPSTQAIGDGYNMWADLVQTRSNGEITVRVFPGSTLIGSNESFASVAMGAVSASNMIGGFQVGDIPALATVGLPFMFDDYDHYERVVNNGLREMVYGWYEARGIRLLNFFPKGSNQIFHSRAFLMEPADFRGAQLRGLGGAADALLQALGANVVRLPTTEVTPALQRGVVDGLVTSCTAHIGRSWYEQTPYVSVLTLKNDMEALGMNLAVWNGLSERHQQIILDAAAEMEAFMWNLIRNEEEVACFEGWAARNVNVQVATPEQRAVIREVVSGLYDSYRAELPELADVLAIVEAQR